MAKIVSIHSFRGGTGKSNMTANLAATIARTGRRVGIVDTDIQSPGIHVLFGLGESKINRALNDYLWGTCSVGETAYDVTPPAVTAAQGRIFLIPASIKAGEIARILREGYDVSLLSDGFQELIKHLKLDYLLIDTHPGLNEETLLSLAISDVLVLLLRPDRQDFQGTAVTVEVARKLNVQRMLIVLNKVLRSMDSARLRSEVETAYAAPVAALFPLSEELMQLASGGVFCLLSPHHPFSLEVQNLARQVMA